jgi:hypothetical protein
MEILKKNTKKKVNIFKSSIFWIIIGLIVVGIIIGVLSWILSNHKKSKSRNFKLALYQGGVPTNAKNGTLESYQNYQTEMLKFAYDKKIDRVFIDISSPDIFKFQTVENLAKIISESNYRGELGAVLEAIPTSNWSGKEVPGGMNPDPETWTTPTKNCINIKKQAEKKATEYCVENTNDINSYCQVNSIDGSGVCHGYSNIKCSIGQNPPGCPNQLQKGFQFLADVNKKVVGDASKFSIVIVDKENVGGDYGGNLFLYINAANKILRPTLNVDTIIEIGQAGQYSMTPASLYTAGTEYITKNKFNCNNAICTKEDAEKNNIKVVTYPEYYWYGELKPKGCIGCPHSLNNTVYQMGASNLTQILQSENCKSCPDNVKQYYTNGKLYDKCIQSKCDETCCKSIGCWSCKYGNSSGNIIPNKNIIYQKNRNDPQGMINDILKYKSLDNKSKDIVKNDRNVWPMFSNEISHNWKASDGGPNGTGDSIDGQENTNNTCISRKYGGDTCGTFDGFGNWDWDKFEEFLQKYADKYGLKQLGIYEWQFISPQWKGR